MEFKRKQIRQAVAGDKVVIKPELKKAMREQPEYQTSASVIAEGRRGFIPTKSAKNTSLFDAGLLLVLGNSIFKGYHAVAPLYMTHDTRYGIAARKHLQNKKVYYIAKDALEVASTSAIDNVTSFISDSAKIDINNRINEYSGVKNFSWASK